MQPNILAPYVSIGNIVLSRISTATSNDNPSTFFIVNNQHSLCSAGLLCESCNSQAPLQARSEKDTQVFVTVYNFDEFFSNVKCLVFPNFPTPSENHDLSFFYVNFHFPSVTKWFQDADHISHSRYCIRTQGNVVSKQEPLFGAISSTYTPLQSARSNISMSSQYSKRIETGIPYNPVEFQTSIRKNPLGQVQFIIVDFIHSYIDRIPWISFRGVQFSWVCKTGGNVELDRMPSRSSQIICNTVLFSCWFISGLVIVYEYRRRYSICWTLTRRRILPTLFNLLDSWSPMKTDDDFSIRWTLIRRRILPTLIRVAGHVIPDEYRRRLFELYAYSRRLSELLNSYSPTITADAHSSFRTLIRRRTTPKAHSIWWTRDSLRIPPTLIRFAGILFAYEYCWRLSELLDS